MTDFTWYLRNLMLVQASDNLEDVIDMSTENLKRLKEEAEIHGSQYIQHLVVGQFFPQQKSDALIRGRSVLFSCGRKL